MKLVITMSRRFGTGASIIADELSKRLDIPVYDRAYIEHRSMTACTPRQKPSVILPKNHVSFSDGALLIFLKDRMNVLNIFVCADKEDRIKRIMKLEDLSYEDAKRKSIRLMNSVLLIIMNIQEKPGG